MFDVGFSELIVIAIVALVVIGPERLPKVARTAGHLLGRMQRYVNAVKSDISREMQLDELKALQAEMQDSARSFERSISSELQAVEQVVDQTAQSVQALVDERVAPTEVTPAEVAIVAEMPAVAATAPAVDSEPAAPTANAADVVPATPADSLGAPLTAKA
jgi:sec-independent protein translocase protein TatB